MRKGRSWCFWAAYGVGCRLERAEYPGRHYKALAWYTFVAMRDSTILPSKNLHVSDPAELESA